MEEKLDKIIDNQIDMMKAIVAIETKAEAKKERVNKLEKDVEGLKKFKWGIIGTAAISVSTFFKSMFY